MSVLAAKLPEVNIVELDSHTLPSIKPASKDDDRLAWLEAQVNQLNQWRESVTSPSTPLLIDGAASPAFSPNSPRSSSSVTSEDLPQLVSSQTLEQLAAPTSNLPKKAISKKDEPLPVRILNIIETYGHNEPSAEGTTWLGRGKFESIVRNSVEANIPIEMVLPAFPWKSVNRVEKVTGALPDLGEELALARLQSLCEDIQAVYEPGAYVTVTSDGLVYCDLVGIPAEEVFEYGKALRNLAEEKGFDRLKFIRIMNLLGLTDSPHMTKEEYLASVESSRQALVEKHLPAGFDVRSDILNDTDINLTYCGYIKFLTKDLKHSPITAGVKSNQEYRRVVKRVAHDMITRGKAFAALIAAVLPHYVRLSIHRSTGLHKLSVPLIPQPNHFSMTPWHCSIAVTAKGQFRTVHASEVRSNFDLVEKDGRPYYFRDRSDVWKWDAPVEFDFIYPKGLVIKASPVDGQQPKFGAVELKKVKEISKIFSPVIPLGFA